MAIQLVDVEQRLTRFEEKLDGINEALVSLARIEERVTTILKHNDRIHEQVQQLDSRIDELESQNAVQEFTLGRGERLFWIGMTVFAGLLASGVAV
jgi:chromosome segregation ATPase